MGDKISIDSATLMNKGFEVIEARWLFGFAGRSDLGHRAPAVGCPFDGRDGRRLRDRSNGRDRYASRDPIRSDLSGTKLWVYGSVDLAALSRLDFEQPDLESFPCLGLAYDAIESGGTMPAVLNAANEIAVEAFLNESIKLSDIAEVNRKVMAAHARRDADSLETILRADAEARTFAENLLPAVKAALSQPAA